MQFPKWRQRQLPRARASWGLLLSSNRASFAINQRRPLRLASTIAPLRGRPASRIQRERLFVVLGRRHKEPHDDSAVSVWLVRDDELPMSVRQELLGFHLEQHL